LAKSYRPKEVSGIIKPVQLESAIILLAAWIIDGRNVRRSGVVSRRDNNDMRYMAEKLEGVADRIKRQFP
jgi:hypothetical protein